MNDLADSHYRAKIGRNAGIIGIGVNILLFMIKLTAGILSGSVSIHIIIHKLRNEQAA